MRRSSPNNNNSSTNNGGAIMMREGGSNSFMMSSWKVLVVIVMVLFMNQLRFLQMGQDQVQVKDVEVEEAIAISMRRKNDRVIIEQKQPIMTGATTPPTTSTKETETAATKTKTIAATKRTATSPIVTAKTINQTNVKEAEDPIQEKVTTIHIDDHNKATTITDTDTVQQKTPKDPTTASTTSATTVVVGDVGEPTTTTTITSTTKEQEKIASLLSSSTTNSSITIINNNNNNIITNMTINNNNNITNITYININNITSTISVTTTNGSSNTSLLPYYYPWPPLESLLENPNNIRSTIIQNVEYVLDFAILGFAKCGTSTMMTWLGSHPEALCFDKEIGYLQGYLPYKLIEKIYEELPHPGNSTHYQRGYKNPSDLGGQQVHDFLRLLWPNVKIIVGIRHPVLWFESFYNYRVQNGVPVNGNRSLTNLIGRCIGGKEMYNVCTDRGAFHIALARLGKTKMNETQHEMKLLKRPSTNLFGNGARRGSSKNSTRNVSKNYVPPYMPNKVFLFDMAQLQPEQKGGNPKTDSKIVQLRHDMKDFMGFQQIMPNIPHHKPGHKYDIETQNAINQLKINICDPKNKQVHDVLLQHAQTSSIWIRNYFLKSPDVYVSSRDYFIQLMKSWMISPCETRTRTTTDKN